MVVAEFVGARVQVLPPATASAFRAYPVLSVPPRTDAASPQIKLFTLLSVGVDRAACIRQCHIECLTKEKKNEGISPYPYRVLSACLSVCSLLTILLVK